MRNDDPGAAPDTVRPALAFCQAWMRGDSEFLLHTSGSTGAPKPITLTRTQMEASARATAAALGLVPGLRFLVCLPTAYVAGRMMLVRGLVLDSEMILVAPSSDPLRDVSQPIDFTAVVPLQLRTLLDGPDEKRALLDGARAILVGGAPVDAALEGAVSGLRAPVWQTWGMTETSTHVALRRLNGTQPDDAFHLLPGAEIRLDGRGCLAVRGPMTNGVWIQTNDLVAIAGERAFRWLGRVDNVINSGGVKVFAETVEAEIAEIMATLDQQASREPRRHFVTGVPDERLGETVALVIEGAPDSDQTQGALLAALRERLGPFRAPRVLLYVDQFSMTGTGKIARAATAKRP